MCDPEGFKSPPDTGIPSIGVILVSVELKERIKISPGIEILADRLQSIFFGGQGAIGRMYGPVLAESILCSQQATGEFNIF